MFRFRPMLIMFIVAVALNGLTAWTCVLWSPYSSHTAPSDERAADGYPAQIAGPYGQNGWWFTAAGVGIWQSVPSGARGAEGEFVYWRGEHTPAYYRAGWPMHSLQSTVTSHQDRARWNLPLREILRRGIQTSFVPQWMRATEGRRLPLVPLWGGFAVDTLFYFCLLIAGRLLMLRILRRTPGQDIAAANPQPLMGTTWR